VQVKEVADLTGLSIRTLHHYDQIGLLSPRDRSAAGYRRYSEEDLKKLTAILFFRELGFPLSEIKAILSHPDFDLTAALDDQIKLLELKRDRLNTMIDKARTLREKGFTTTDMNMFDTKAIDTYAAEVKERWGHTDAYRAFQAKNATADENQAAGDALMALFAALGQLKNEDPAAPTVQAAVQAIQDHISAHFYPCSKEIFAGLGQMYAADDRFRENIDRAGGEGTARFAAEAIAIFCQK